MSRPSITCRHCGSTATETASGIDDSAHFPDLVYKRCLACGHEEVLSKGAPGHSHAIRRAASARRTNSK